MLNRYPYLANRTVLADSGELTIDINIRDPITALTVELRASHGTTSNAENDLCQNVAAIEVIDGSDVIFSMDGYEAISYAIQTLGDVPINDLSECPNVTVDQTFYIPFGRFYGDMEYSLDPTKFINPQLRLKWNLATNTAVGVTGFNTNSGRVTVIPHVMEGAPSPSHILTAKEVYSWAISDDATEYIDLPRDYPYKAIMIRATKAATSLDGCLEQIKLNCDADKFVPWNMRFTDYLRHMMMWQLPFHTRKMYYLNNGDTLYCMFKQKENVMLNCYDPGDRTTIYANNGAGEGLVRVYAAGVASTAKRLIMALITGWCPWACQLIPFGDPLDPGSWFPAKTFNSIRLEVEGAADDATGYVCVVQDRTY